MSPDTELLSDQQYLTNYNWPLVQPDGMSVNFNSARDKLVFVNFWATWCPPCIAELPAIERLFADYGNEIEFYLVSNETPEVVKGFIKRKEYDLPVYLSAVSSPAPLQYTLLPTTYLIGRDGHVLLREEGAANWNNEGFRKLLDSLIIAR